MRVRGGFFKIFVGFDGELGGEVHLERVGEMVGGGEGEVRLAVEHLRHVGTRHVEPTRKRRLVEAQFFHAHEHRTEEERADSVDCVHGVYELKLRVEVEEWRFSSFKLRVEVEERMFPYFFMSDAIIAPTSLARSSIS